MVIIATLVILVVGAVVGLLAYLVVPGRRSVPVWAAVLVGIAGMLLGTLVASLLGVDDGPGVDWVELAIQVGLAVAGVAVLAAVRSRGRTPAQR